MIAPAADRVADGAAYLDRVMPGWVDVLDMGIFDIRSDCRCVLGQLALDKIPLPRIRRSGFTAWMMGMVPGVDRLGSQEDQRLGFEVPEWSTDDHLDGGVNRVSADEEYARLQQAWVDLISARRAVPVDGS